MGRLSRGGSLRASGSWRAQQLQRRREAVTGAADATGVGAWRAYPSHYRLVLSKEHTPAAQAPARFCISSLWKPGESHPACISQVGCKHCGGRTIRRVVRATAHGAGRPRLLSLPNGHAGPGGAAAAQRRCHRPGGAGDSSPAVMSVRQAAARALQSVPSQGGGASPDLAALHARLPIWRRQPPAGVPTTDSSKSAFSLLPTRQQGTRSTLVAACCALMCSYGHTRTWCSVQMQAQPRKQA